MVVLNGVQSFVEYPHISINYVVQDRDRFVHRILKWNKWHPHKMHLVQELYREDPGTKVIYFHNKLNIINFVFIYAIRKFHLNNLHPRKNGKIAKTLFSRKTCTPGTKMFDFRKKRSRCLSFNLYLTKNPNWENIDFRMVSVWMIIPSAHVGCHENIWFWYKKESVVDRLHHF